MVKNAIIAFDISKYDNNVFLYYNTLYDERDKPIKEFGNISLNEFNKLTVVQKKDFFDKKRLNNNPSKTTRTQTDTLSIINKSALRDKRVVDNNNTSKTIRRQAKTLSKKIDSIIHTPSTLLHDSKKANTRLSRLRKRLNVPTYVRKYRQPSRLETVQEKETFDDLDNMHGGLGSSSLKDKEKLKKQKEKEKLKKQKEKEKLKKQKDKEKLKKETEKDKEKLKKQKDKEKLKKETEKDKEKLKKQTEKEKLKKQKDKEKLKKQKDKSQSLFNFNNVIKKKRLSKKIKGGEISNDYIKNILNSFKTRDIQHDFKIKITKKIALFYIVILLHQTIIQHL